MWELAHSSEPDYGLSKPNSNVLKGDRELGGSESGIPSMLVYARHSASPNQELEAMLGCSCHSGYKNCYKNACEEQDLVYGMTETDSVQVGLELNAFTSASRGPRALQSSGVPGNFVYFTQASGVIASSLLN